MKLETMTQNELYQYALIGLTSEQQRIQGEIAKLQGFVITPNGRKMKIGYKANAKLDRAIAEPPKRHVSPEGRARIAAAQRKRWRLKKKASKK